MGKVVAMVGVFAGLMALFGAVVSMLVAATGNLAGADDSGAIAVRGLGAVLAAATGIAGAAASRTRPALGASIMLASSAVGVVLITWYYAAGAILFLAASTLALRAGPGRSHSSP